MPFDVSLTITGIQEAQAANLRAMRAAKPDGGLGRAVWYAAIDLHRYMVSITHVKTGALRASERAEMKDSARAEIFIDPSSVNPRTGEKPADYGFTENARGGEHAFMARTFFERGGIATERASVYLQGLI